MDAITHLFVGRLLGVPLGGPLGWLVTLFAVLPDFDTVSWAFPRLRRYVTHRGVTHTLPFGVAASLLAGAVFAFAGWSSFAAAFGAAMLGFLSHVALDVLNWGAPVAWPVRRQRVAWTIHGGFVWSAALSAAGLCALALVHAWAPQALAGLVAFLGGGFAAYLALRACLKLWAARRHPGRTLLPTGNPLVWRVLDATGEPTA